MAKSKKSDIGLIDKGGCVEAGQQERGTCRGFIDMDRFAQHFAISGNSTQAGMYAGASSSKVAAQFLARNKDDPTLIALITKERSNNNKKYEVLKDGLMQVMYNCAAWDVGDYYDKDGKPVPLKDLDFGQRQAIAKIRENGSYVLVDKSKMMPHITRALGMNQDNVNITEERGGNMQTSITKFIEIAAEKEGVSPAVLMKTLTGTPEIEAPEPE